MHNHSPNLIWINHALSPPVSSMVTFVHLMTGILLATLGALGIDVAIELIPRHLPIRVTMRAPGGRETPLSIAMIILCPQIASTPPEYTQTLPPQTLFRIRRITTTPTSMLGILLSKRNRVHGLVGTAMHLSRNRTIDPLGRQREPDGLAANKIFLQQTGATTFQNLFRRRRRLNGARDVRRTIVIAAIAGGPSPMRTTVTNLNVIDVSRMMIHREIIERMKLQAQGDIDTYVIALCRCIFLRVVVVRAVKTSPK